MTEVLPKNSFPERIRTLISLYGNKEKLAKACGISAVMIGKYESGSEPSRDKLVALAQATGVRIEWLVAGSGEMRVEAQIASDYVGESYETFNGSLVQHQDIKPDNLGRRRADDKYCYIPLYSVRASAGGGAVVDRENVIDFLSFKTEWIRTQLNASQNDLYLIHVEGESMEPTLRSGDVILVDHRQAAALPSDGVYVLRMDDTLLVKRLQRLPGAQIRVTSDNPAYQPFTLSLATDQNEMEIVGRVVWCGRRM